MQAELNFQIHEKESNLESQRYRDSGRDSFSKNCKILFDSFMRGNVINNINSPVNEFRRRRQDLTDTNGVKISLHSTDGRIKNWYMTKGDINYNKNKFGG